MHVCPKTFNNKKNRPITCTDSIGSDDGCHIDNFLDNRLEKAQHLSKSKQSKQYVKSH